MRPLGGKVVVVTGGSRGLGLAVARRFASAGAKVVLGGRSEQALESAADSLRREGAEVAFAPCDVGDLAQVEQLADRAVEAFGGFDVWINNAGTAGPYGPTVELDPAAFEQVVRTNVLGTYHGSVVALRHLLPRRAGALVNTLGRGARQPVPFQNAYASSKAWVRSFTRALAREHRDSGVAIHLVQPGLVDTRLLRSVDVVKGHEHRLSAFGTIVAMWAQPPEAAAEHVFRAVTRGGTGGEVSGQGTPTFLWKAVRHGVGRMLGRARPAEIEVRAIPPAWKAPDGDGDAAADRDGG